MRAFYLGLQYTPCEVEKKVDLDHFVHTAEEVGESFEHREDAPVICEGCGLEFCPNPNCKKEADQAYQEYRAKLEEVVTERFIREATEFASGGIEKIPDDEQHICRGTD